MLPLKTGVSPTRQLAITQAKTLPLAAHGRPTAEEQKNKGDNVTFTRGSNSQAYLLRRLARDAPEVLPVNTLVNRS